MPKSSPNESEKTPKPDPNPIFHPKSTFRVRWIAASLISSTVRRSPNFMPEQRARTYHRNRVANTFSEEIGAMLEGELSDPRIAPSYVTDVVLAPGGKSARIFVAVHGNEEEEASTLEGLKTARAYIRSQLRDRMGVRHVPELTFAIDRSEKMTGRMEELLARTRKRDQKRTVVETAQSVTTKS
jgi:ribosome-binding factor A